MPEGSVEQVGVRVMLSDSIQTFSMLTPKWLLCAGTLATLGLSDFYGMANGGHT